MKKVIISFLFVSSYCLSEVIDVKFNEKTHKITVNKETKVKSVKKILLKKVNCCPLLHIVCDNREMMDDENIVECNKKLTAICSGLSDCLSKPYLK